MSNLMEAVRIERPGETALVKVAVPRPQAGEVLLRIDRVGYCGSDLSTFRGGNPLVTYPRIPGHEIAAVIVDAGSDVPPTVTRGTAATVVPYTACGKCPSCRRGRTNACQFNQTLGVQRDGAMTRFLTVPWQKLRFASLSMAELALVEPLSVGFHAVARGRVTREDTVVVFGCGMIGLGAIAAAGLELGATVIAVDVAAGKLPLAQSAGAKHVIDASRENVAERIRELTGGNGADVAIEAVGAAATYRLAIDVVAFTGRVVYIGYGKELVAYETRLFVQKELDILGSRNATDQDFDAVIAMLQRGKYPTAATITRTVPLAEAGAALADWSANPGAITKIQIDFAAEH